MDWHIKPKLARRHVCELLLACGRINAAPTFPNTIVFLKDARPAVYCLCRNDILDLKSTKKTKTAGIVGHHAGTISAVSVGD